VLVPVLGRVWLADANEPDAVPQAHRSLSRLDALMRAGDLDRTITIQRFTEIGRDPFNEPIMDWAPLATVSASVEHLRDTERWAAQEVGAEATLRFQIRYSSTVASTNPKDRLLYEEREHNIIAVKELGRRRGLEITATARVD
jgi:SPP1 family predicted phage head-tail adaptor